MSPIDQSLKDLLVREAHLRLSRAQLAPVWSKKEAELRAIQTARPTFIPVFSRRAREVYEARLREVQEVVTVLRQGMDVLDRLEPHVKKLITEELENILRADHPEYFEGLAALRQKDDWMRCVDRFAEKINAFTGQLGNVRNIACSGYGKKAQADSQNAGQAFQLAIDAAQKLEEEIGFANKISETRSRIFVTHGFKSRPLPKLAPTGFAAWVAKISTLPLAKAQVQFDQLSERAKKLVEVELRELRATAEAIDGQQTNEVQRPLLALWEEFRAQVVGEIYPGDTARVIEETESLLLAPAELPLPRCA